MSNRSGAVRIISRDRWGAEPLKEGVTLELMNLPVDHVIFTYDTETNRCYTMGQCTKEVKYIETRWLQKGCRDIPYNFIVGGDGFVYEGRGWSYKPEKHAKFENVYGSSIEIAFIGDYRTSGIPPKTVDFGLKLVELGIDMDYIVKKYTLLEATPKHHITYENSSSK